MTNGDGEIFNIFREHATCFKEVFIHHYLLKRYFFMFHSFPFLLTMHHIPFPLFMYFLSYHSFFHCIHVLISLSLSIHPQARICQNNYVFLAENMELAKRRYVPLVFSWPDLCMLSDMQIKGQKYFLQDTELCAGFIRDVKCLRIANLILQPHHKPEENISTFFN